MRGKLTRRRFLATTAASTALIAMPYVRGSHAAGRLSIGFWDHWVPSANNTSKALVEEWAAKEKVEVLVDYIPTQGQKLLLTIAAEAQAKSGHDILALSTWLPSDHANQLEPVDDIVEPLIKQNGTVNAAEACQKAGFPFGIGLGTTPDSVDTAGAIFHSFGAMLVDAKGNVTVKSDPVRQALEYYTKLAKFFPPDAPAWDDSSNNKWLISGRGALIMTPPSAWAVAKRDAPQVAEQCWTHGMAAGPKGRFAPCVPYFWGIWSFGKNKEAAKSLLVHLSQPAAIEKLVAASGGYDLPSFANLTTFRTWAEEGPPKGTLYHYPNPHNHQTLSVAAAPAPPKIAHQIYTQAILTKMIVKHMQGETMEKTLAWAESEIEGFMRT